MADDYVVGVDIGGTKTSIGYQAREELEKAAIFPTPEDPDSAVDRICEAIRESCPSESISSIGIGCPGPLDRGSGKVLTPPNLPRWHGYPLAGRIEERIGAPVVLDNDGNLGALGEATHGNGRGYSSVLYLAVGTGLGAGLVKNGKVDHGASGHASELWAFEPASFSGKPGPPVNDIASGRGLVLECKRAMADGHDSMLGDDFDTPDLVAAYAAGDQAAGAAFARARDCLTAALIFAVLAVDPAAVVLGGGMCDDPTWFVEPISSLYRQRMPIRELKHIPVMGPALFGDAVIMGALTLASAGR